MGDTAHLMRELVDLEHVGTHTEEHVFEESGENAVRLEEELGEGGEPLLDHTFFQFISIVNQEDEDHYEANNNHVENLTTPDQLAGLLEH